MSARRYAASDDSPSTTCARTKCDDGVRWGGDEGDDDYEFEERGWLARGGDGWPELSQKNRSEGKKWVKKKTNTNNGFLFFVVPLPRRMVPSRRVRRVHRRPGRAPSQRLRDLTTICRRRRRPAPASRVRCFAFVFRIWGWDEERNGIISQPSHASAGIRQQQRPTS